MAKEKNSSTGDNTVDNQTLVDNMKSMELENTMLHKQLQDLKDQICKNDSVSEMNANLSQQIDTLTGQAEAMKEQISTLQAERDDLANRIEEDKKVYANTDNIFQEENAELHKQLEETKKLLENAKNEIKKMQLKPAGLILHDFPQAMLNKLSEKLSAKYNREVTPQMIVEDYLIKYNFSERWTEWFHPFVLERKDLLDIAQNINPEIKDLQELRKALNLHEN